MPNIEERRRANGQVRYVVRVRDPYPAAGKVGYTSATFATRPEAQRFVRDVDDRGVAWALDEYRRAKEGDSDDGEMTLEQWALRYLDSLTNVGPDTLVNYRRDWNNRWSPHLGHLRMSQLRREHVAKALKQQPGADKTVANAWGILTSILNSAVIDGHLARSPALGVKLPRRSAHEKVEHRYLTPDEIMQVIEDTPERYKPLVWMLAGTGMRWGEATALTVGDVDLKAGTVRIVKAIKRDRQQRTFYVGPTKTPKARRTIALPNEVIEVLKPLVRGRKSGERLFTNRNGDLVKHQPFYREHWRNACTSNVSELRPRIHDLRHSHVAILIAQGVPLPVIQARLGHEKITTTIDTYGHLLPDLQRAAADAASQVFARTSPPKELG